MDYTTKSPKFKIKKALRYARLYGPSRTLIKIRGQYHMKKHYDHLPLLPSELTSIGHVGLIGCGNFAFSNIAYYLKKNYGNVIRGAMDIDINKAASIYEKYGLSYYTNDAENILNDPLIDLIFIASNHASHADYAEQALRAGKSVHIEKPPVVREDQLDRLCNAMLECNGHVNLGFNRPRSQLGELIKYYVNSQSGSAMFNWFISGHKISPEHWYFKEEEGGRILGNLCHWTDFVLNLVSPENRYPIIINPTRGVKSDCDIAVTYTFGDETIACITFSAKGHTFEGVRERFSAHRGNVLIFMDDFYKLIVENVEKKRKYFRLFRDHGHKKNIKLSYQMVRPNGNKLYEGYSIEDVWETSELFLKTREALNTNQQIKLNSFESSVLGKSLQ